MPDYFTLEEFRDLPEMDKEGKYGDEDVERAASYITGVIERAVGIAFVPRTVTKSMTSAEADALASQPYIQEVTSITPVSSSSPFRGAETVTVVYQAGYSTEPPADIKEAAMQATRARLLEKHGTARVMDRTSSVSNDAGGTTAFVLAGPDRPTGYPEVDAVILGWRRALFSLGFA